MDRYRSRYFHLYSLIVAYWKAWDALAWVVGKIADWVEKKKIKNFYEE